jgi:hypothetical protein
VEHSVGIQVSMDQLIERASFVMICFSKKALKKIKKQLETAFYIFLSFSEFFSKTTGPI